jgi:ribosomal protein L7/L12
MVTGLGLKDSKDIVDRASTSRPEMICKRVDRESADKVAQLLADAGATFQIVGHIGGRPIMQPTRVKLVLHEVASAQRLEAIRLVREATGFSLVDAKDLVERVIAGRGPEILTATLPPARANGLAIQFARIGRATVEP